MSAAETEALVARLEDAFWTAKQAFARTGPVPCIVASDDVERIIARLAPAPLPEGMEHTVMATGADILREGWQWRYAAVDEWREGRDPVSGSPLPDVRYECRPPQPEPQMVAVMLPADVVQRFSDPAADLRLTAVDEAAVIHACRAALTEGGKS